MTTRDLSHLVLPISHHATTIKPDAEPQTSRSDTVDLLSSGIHLVHMGRALVVDLSKDMKGVESCTVDAPHCTVIFRQQGFDEAELRELVGFRAEWLESLNRPAKGGRCTFDVSRRWGEKSNHVDGELREFVEATRAHFTGRFGLEKQRPPHVEMRG